MSDNKLLNEGTIRRFMKLANVEALTDNFIQENTEEETEIVLEEEDPMEEDPMGEEPMEEEPAEIEDDSELDADPEADMDEPAAADISLTEEEAQLLIDLGERLREAMGSEQEDDDLGLEDDDLDLEDEPMDDEEPMGEEGPMGDEEPGSRLDTALYENKAAIIEEVLKRVTKRIVAKKLSRG